MIRDDYGCDWLIDARRSRWQGILDRALPDAIRVAYKRFALDMEMSALWGKLEWSAPA